MWTITEGYSVGTIAHNIWIRCVNKSYYNKVLLDTVFSQVIILSGIPDVSITWVAFGSIMTGEYWI